MDTSRTIAALGLAATAMASTTPALGQTAWTPVPRAESLIRLELPGLAQSRQSYAWQSASNMNGIFYVGVQVATTGEYPRGEALTTQAYGFASIQSSSDLDEQRLKSSFTYFRNRTLNVERALTADSTRDRKVLRFTLEGAGCVAYYVFPSGVDWARAVGGNGSVSVFGYYCGAPGVTLSDTDIQWVLWGNEVMVPNTKTMVRLAAAPATPPSAVLSTARIAPGPLDEGFAAYRRGDYATTLRLMRPLADQGNSGAQNLIGLLYLNGQGAPKDPAEAIAWFRKAAAQGNSSGDANLGNMYRSGNGVTRDYAEALKLFRKAADRNNAFAIHSIGLMHAGGEGTPRNLDEAKKWLDRAIELYPEADRANRDRAIRDRDSVARQMTPGRVG
jgi:tetratricopeptide (TPR) repeat protein